MNKVVAARKLMIEQDWINQSTDNNEEHLAARDGPNDRQWLNDGRIDSPIGPERETSTKMAMAMEMSFLRIL